MTLACEDAYSKLEVVTGVGDEDCVGNSLMQIWKLRFAHKSLSTLVKILNFRRDFEAEVWSVFCC